MNEAKKRIAVRITVALAVALISAGTGIWIQATRFGIWVEQRTYDLRFVFRGPLPQSSAAPITIVAVDDRSLNEIPEPLMVWHARFAKAIDALVDAGAAAIGVDFLFSDITRFDPQGQQSFSQSLLKAGLAGVPVVLAYRVNPAGVEQPPAAILQAALGIGHELGFVNLTTDNDDFVRRQQLATRDSDGQIRPSFAWAVARAFTRNLQTPLAAAADDQVLLINFAGPDHFDSVSFQSLIQTEDPGTGELKSRLKGRIVLIGPYGITGSEDVHPTPFYYAVDRRYSLRAARTPGIEIHANTLATVLNGNAIEQLRSTPQQLIVLGTALFATYICFRFRPFLALALTFGAIAGYLVIAMRAFHSDLWLLVVSPAAGMVLAAGLSQTANYLYEGREKRRLRNLFKSYVHDEVIERILEVSGRFVLAGESKHITVLFADIRSFTTRSEGVKAKDLVADLNLYFKAMIEAIHKHNGMIDKFIGDGIMALFGVPLDDPDAALHAVQAAQEMLRALDVLNEKLCAARRQPIHIGIGIHSGEVVVGNIGSPERMEYTAIGDVVNTASRVEGLTRRLKADILITSDTFEEVRGRIPAECLGPQVLRGRAQPIVVYKVIASTVE